MKIVFRKQDVFELLICYKPLKYWLKYLGGKRLEISLLLEVKLKIQYSNGIGIACD